VQPLNPVFRTPVGVANRLVYAARPGL